MSSQAGVEGRVSVGFGRAIFEGAGEDGEQVACAV